MAMGRPPKPYRPSWGGDPISGLARQTDGRWRIVATGERFTEIDERRAIQKFRDWQARQNPSTAFSVASTTVAALEEEAAAQARGEEGTGNTALAATLE